MIFEICGFERINFYLIHLLVMNVNESHNREECFVEWLMCVKPFIINNYPFNNENTILPVYYIVY